MHAPLFQPLPPQLESKGPVLHKLLEAFQWASRVYAVGLGASELQEGSLLVQGEAVSGEGKVWKREGHWLGILSSASAGDS